MGHPLNFLKNIKPFHYLLIAVLVHVILGIIFMVWKIIPAATTEVLFKATVEEKPQIQPKERQTQEFTPKEQMVRKEIPAHIVKEIPKVKRRVMVKADVKAPIFAAPPTVVIPKKVELSDKGIDLKVEKQTTISTVERGKREATYRQFAKQFKVSGMGRQVKASFTPVLAQYHDGDWNKDPAALPNLMREVNKRSNVTAEETPKIVSVDSEEIFKCPFVFFTGTRDFTLTAAEVENLRKFLLKGGLVWADNGLPGRRSRFDIAFRREMKKVLPDRDFEVIKNDHKIFSAFYNLNEVPAGMNFRKDPIEVINMDKRALVIYTLNDYSDFWETRFDDDGKADDSFDKYWYGRLWGPHWEQRNSIYENLNEETVEQAYQLGLNMVSYLLTR